MAAATTNASPKVACETKIAARPKAQQNQVTDDTGFTTAAQQIAQTMADVILAGRRQRVLAAAQPAEKDEGRVEDRQAEHQQRDHPRYGGAVAGEAQLDRHRRQHKAEEECASITE